jgi:hypothetical protein
MKTKKPFSQDTRTEDELGLHGSEGKQGTEEKGRE